jgi:hypothetical protein
MAMQEKSPQPVGPADSARSGGQTAQGERESSAQSAFPHACLLRWTGRYAKVYHEMLAELLKAC